MSRPSDRAFVFSLLVVLCVAVRLPAQDDSNAIRQKVLERLQRTGVQRSACGRFVVLGRNRLENTKLLGWAQEFTGKFERATGIKMPSDRWRLRILIENAGIDELPAVTLSTRHTEGWTTQQLNIRHSYQLEMGEAAERLTWLLLQASVLHGVGKENPLVRPRRPEDVVAVPHWLSRGLAHSFYADLRARDSDEGVDRWERGKLPALAGFLRVADRYRKAADSPMSGLVVGWMLSQRGSRADLRRLLARLGERRTCPPEWLLTLFGSCRSVMDLESAWDGWILAQRRVVHQPGVATLRVVRELARERLLYGGDSGIPSKGCIGYRTTMRELIDSRGEPWLRDVARLKSGKLRLLGVGRGKEVAEIVDQYCTFLAAVARGGKEKDLREQLDAAEHRLQRLKNMTMAEQSAGPEGRRTE